MIIQHPDGSRAGYWHLQHNGALVKVGDTVTKGQVIALSGKTGYAMTPHLHFLV
ncbi:MAG: M23 family metallopeptidase [Chitinophagaceae bacterium]|nr:M23 family metallopeptidase [Chitinophagaceae bacterium]